MLHERICALWGIDPTAHGSRKLAAEAIGVRPTHYTRALGHETPDRVPAVVLGLLDAGVTLWRNAEGVLCMERSQPAAQPTHDTEPSPISP